MLILDLHLRSGSGFGVLRSLARDKASQRPKVIILTNFGLPEYRREAESFGVEAFLDKSRDYFRLPALLRDFAKERSAGGPASVTDVPGALTQTAAGNGEDPLERQTHFNLRAAVSAPDDPPFAAKSRGAMAHRSESVRSQCAAPIDAADRHHRP